MLRGKIDSNPVILDVISQDHPWIPNTITMRPTPADLAKKQAWQPPYELHSYLLDTLFMGRQWAFVPALFRYNTTGNHYILWNSEQSYFYDYDDEHINTHINNFIKQTVGNTADYEFVWYKNPKPSVPELYHVHVFWIALTE
jgi:hypothetical protein